MSASARPTERVMPEGVEWIKSRVTAFDPDKNCVRLENDVKVIMLEECILCHDLSVHCRSPWNCQWSKAFPSIWEAKQFA